MKRKTQEQQRKKAESIIDELGVMMFGKMGLNLKEAKELVGQLKTIKTEEEGMAIVESVCQKKGIILK